MIRLMIMEGIVFVLFICGMLSVMTVLAAAMGAI